VSSREIDARLRTACAQGDLALIKRLLSAGVDPNSADGDGWSALHYAAAAGHGEVVKTLIEAEANLNVRANKYGWTPLHFAAGADRSRDVAIELLNAGADATLTDSVGRTPFDMQNGRAVREYYESRLAAKAISDVFEDDIGKPVGSHIAPGIML
jgi:uncharacterized protein